MRPAFGLRDLGARTTLAGAPRYDHVLAILAENKDYGQIMSVTSAPNLIGLTKQYGDAARFDGEEDAFGIRERLGLSGDEAAEVNPMTPLFTVK